MAILKHISVKNRDYGEGQRYLLFEHDPKTQELLLDENGDMIIRKGLIQSGLNCDPFTFNTECTELNRKWGKNLSRKDVKVHHYILSFDPRDATENGLTPQRAHKLAEEFAGRYFAGHQVLMVTHADGHNSSGNIHTHIVLNSLRKETVPRQDFMERPIDAMAGYKHHQTRDLLQTMQIAVNEMCAREHLHTVDYTYPSDRRISDLEYQAKLKGQKELDSENAEIIADGLKPRTTDFETIKEQIRKSIDACAAAAHSEEEFIRRLRQQYGITVRSKRGTWSFSVEERKKPIRDRSLGRIYLKNEIEKRIGVPQQTEEPIPIEYEDLPKIFLIHSDIRLVVDIQNCVKAQQNHAYARKVSISNLQQMAKSVVYLQTHGIDSREKLNRLCEESEQKYNDASSAMRETKAQLKSVNEQIHYLGQYLATKALYTRFMQSADKATFRIEHKVEIDKYEETHKHLMELFPTGGFPNMKQLKAEKAKLKHSLTHQKNNIQSESKDRDTLRTVRTNVNTLLGYGFEKTKEVNID